MRSFLVRFAIGALFVVLAGFLAKQAVDIVGKSQYVDLLVNCEAVPEYCTVVEELKELFFETVALPTSVALVILVLLIPSYFLSLLWPRPRLSSFGRGFNRKAI